MATLSNLQRIRSLEWLARYVRGYGPDAVATFEGTLSSLTLLLFRCVTIYSGLFQGLATLQGATTGTAVRARACGMIMLFQLLLVLLASLITSSVFSVLFQLLEQPLLLPTLLASSLPFQATFFLHYLLNACLFTALRKACLVEHRKSACYSRCGRTDKGVSAFGQVGTLRPGAPGARALHTGAPAPPPGRAAAGLPGP